MIMIEMSATTFEWRMGITDRVVFPDNVIIPRILRMQCTNN